MQKLIKILGTAIFGFFLSAMVAYAAVFIIPQGGTGADNASGARTNLGVAIGSDVQAYDPDLTTYAGITPSANIQTLLGSANYAAARTNLGLVIGTNVQAYDADLTTYAGITPSANIQTLLGSADYAAARTNLGLVIGTNVQAYDADLTTYAGITPSANVQTLLGAADFAAMRTSLGLVIGTNVQAYDADLTTYAGITPSANIQTFLGSADNSAARTNLGLAIGTNVQAYDADLTTYAGITPSANVQTLLGAANYAAFKTSLSLNNVENTALSTWAGSTNITTLGTITSGTWTGTTIAVANGGTGATSLNNLITLATHTTGNYVATAAGTSNEISVSGSGSENAAVTISLPSTIDLGGKTSFEIPNGAAPTIANFGEIAGDNNLWGSGRGAPIFYDGTSSTALVNVLTSDTPANGQVPKWNTGGTITWEDDTSGSGVKLPTLIVAASGGDYTTIQGAIDACAASFTAGCEIYLTDSSYTVSSTLLIKSNNVHIVGNHGDTILSFDGSSVSPMIKTNAALYSGLHLKNLYIQQTNGTAQGVAVDGSDIALGVYEKLFISAAGTAMKFSDANNLTFYNTVRDVTIFDSNICIDINGSTPTNDNSFYNIRCAPNVNQGPGLRITRGQSNVFYNFNCEPGTPTGITCISLTTANTADTQFYGLYVEAAATNLSIGAGVVRTTIVGGELCCAATTNISDAGTDTVFINTDDDFGTPKTQLTRIDLGATGVKLTNDSDGAITLLGQSAGADEDLTINLDDTADHIVLSSSTGVTDFDLTSMDLLVGGSDVSLGSAGVKMTGDGDGAITFLGLGNGSDEDLTINLDDTSNEATVTSSTSLSLFNLSGINLKTPKVGIGANPDANRLLYVTGDVSGGVATIERTNASTNAAVGTVIVKGTSTGDMVDGFGSAFQFAIQDTAAVENLIADVRGVRNGADNTGKLVFGLYSAGSGNPEMELTLTALSPSTTDGTALGTTSLMWSDLFVASGAVLNFNNGNYTITHSAGLLTFSGGITATAGTVTLGTLAGTIDAGGATSFEIPNGTGPTISVTGQVAVDTTDDQLRYQGSSTTRNITWKMQKSAVFESPASGDNWTMWKTPDNITIDSIKCIVDPADSSESVVITVNELNADGDSASGVDGATTITCGNTSTSDDGSLSNPTIDADDWIGIDPGTVTGTVTALSVTINYHLDTE